MLVQNRNRHVPVELARRYLGVGTALDSHRRLGEPARRTPGVGTACESPRSYGEMVVEYHEVGMAHYNPGRIEQDRRSCTGCPRALLHSGTASPVSAGEASLVSAGPATIVSAEVASLAAGQETPQSERHFVVCPRSAHLGRCGARCPDVFAYAKGSHEDAEGRLPDRHESVEDHVSDL
jgi:hypothetical protein